MHLLTAEEMREIDRMTIESFGLPGRVLMENAGQGATRILLNHVPDIAKKRVGVLAGSGNNGGDGFVIARYLAREGVRVTVYLLSQRAKIKGDAAANFTLLAPLNIPVKELPEKESFFALRTDLHHEDIWVDAILGTGLNADVRGYFKDVITFINSLNKPVFSVDIPSGLNSDTGQPCGVCIRAFITATFAFPKIGHVLYPGADFTGDLRVVDIGIPGHIVDKVQPKRYLLTPDRISTYFKPRPPEAHKGHTGHLMVVAGSPGKTGAAAMTAVSAMRAGAGLVTLGTPKSLNPMLETMVLEPMTYPLPETVDGMLDESAFDAVMRLLPGKTCMALGPGLGTSGQTEILVHRLIRESTVPLVIDADGLNNLAGNTRVLENLKVPCILTPHPGEMSRLVDAPVPRIQKDRIGYALDFAVKFQVHVVLKGARTVIAHPDGRVFVNPTGNAGMASGGMGDVLTGIIAGLVAQGFSCEHAAHAGVFMHGAAGDELARKKGPFGFIASDVMKILPEEIEKRVSND